MAVAPGERNGSHSPSIMFVTTSQHAGHAGHASGSRVVGCACLMLRCRLLLALLKRQRSTQRDAQLHSVDSPGLPRQACSCPCWESSGGTRNRRAAGCR